MYCFSLAYPILFLAYVIICSNILQEICCHKLMCVYFNCSLGRVTEATTIFMHILQPKCLCDLMDMAWKT